MARIDNLKQYEQMCNAYEARILELESELNHVQQEYDELSFKYQEAVSQIETSEKHLIDAEPRDLEKTHNSYRASCISIGKIIKTMRIESGLTQKELSENIGINIRLLQQYESGERHPKFERLCMIARSLNFPIADLVNEVVKISEEFFGDYLGDKKKMGSQIETHEEEENG